MPTHIIINLIDTPNIDVNQYRWQDTTDVGEVLVNGTPIAAIWESETPVAATSQAEHLWSKNIPARIVHNDEEEKRFVLQLLLQATPPQIHE